MASLGKLRRIVSVEECRRLLATAEESEWYPLFCPGTHSADAPSEYLALRWSDIDWLRGASSVSKTIQLSGSLWVFDDTKRMRDRRVVKLQSFVLAALEILKVKQTMGGEGNVGPRTS
jgi:integrase